jgi:hypothetical protein
MSDVPDQRPRRPKPPEPRLTKKVVAKPDGRYLILYEPKRPREDKR